MDPATLAALLAAVATVVSAALGSAALVLLQLRDLRLEERKIELEWERLRRGIESGGAAPPAGTVRPLPGARTRA